MHIHLLAVGEKMPAWVETGFHDYCKRLPRDWRLQLHEIPLAKRGKNATAAQWLAEEGARLRAAIPAGAHTVALAIAGQTWTSEEFATVLQRWRDMAKPIALLIGGPDGLAPDVLAQAAERWSLSPLTLPHPLVRIVIAEQLYRAWSLLHHHPYHR